MGKYLPNRMTTEERIEASIKEKIGELRTYKEEYVLIKNKKSTLSRREREFVIKTVEEG